MMKKTLLLFTIALSLGIFVSCKSNTPSAGAGKTTDMKPEAGSEILPGNVQSASDGVAAPDGNLAEPGALKIVYNEYRGIDLGDGYYELCANGDGTGNILYTDLATMQRIYLSPDLASDHHSEADPSFIADTSGGLCIFADESYLFIQKNGNETAPAALYRADLNGENRRKLLEFKQYLPISKSVVSDGAYLYTILTEGPDKSVLAKISPESGDIEEICELPYDNNFLMDTFDDSLVIKGLDIPDPKKTKDAVDSFKNTKHVVYRYSLTDNRLTEVIRWQQDTMYEGYDGQFMYVFDFSNDCLKTIDLRYGTETVMLESLKEKGIDVDDNVSITTVKDGHMLYGAGGFSYILDLSTMEVTKRKYMDNYKEPFIIASYGNKYLVTAGDLEIPLNGFDPAGNPIIINYTIPQLALIDPEDFWNSDYNFEPVKNTFQGE